MASTVPSHDVLRAVRKALYDLSDRTYYRVTAEDSGVRVSYQDGPSRKAVAETCHAVLGADTPVTIARRFSPEAMLSAETRIGLELGQLDLKLVDERGRVRGDAPERIETKWCGRVFAGTAAEVLELVIDESSYHRGG